MARVIEVDASMLDDVHELVSAFDNTQTTRAMWARALCPPWGSEDRPVGYAIRDNGNLTGFVGTLFSEREVGGRTTRLCNVHSLILREEHRGDGAKLIMKPLRLRDTTLTVFTPVRNVADFLPGVGFTNIGDKVRILPPSGSGSIDGLELEHDPAVIRDELDEAGARVVDHHRHEPCRHVLARHRGRTCHLVYTAVAAAVSYAFLLHVSDPELFCELSVPLRQAVMAASGTRSVAVDDRLLGGRRPARSFALPIDVRRHVRPGAGEEALGVIDNLYSEFALLNVAAVPSAREEVRQRVAPRLERLRSG